MTILGKRLKELRESKGLSLMEFGKQFGIDARTIRRWESGQVDIGADKIIRLALLFDVSIDYLLGLTDII